MERRFLRRPAFHLTSYVCMLVAVAAVAVVTAVVAVVVAVVATAVSVADREIPELYKGVVF